MLKFTIKNTISMVFLLLLLFFSINSLNAEDDTYLLIPMDDAQTNHLKAYGLSYFALQQGLRGEWLLNYRGGSFLLPDREVVWQKAVMMNVFYERIYDDERHNIYKTITENNMGRLELTKAPKMAVYKPPTLKEPWDDAVTLVLAYAEIPFTQLWDEEVLSDKLLEYDWLHLHHEDFSGQFGKIGYWYGSEAWFIQDVMLNKKTAKKLKYGSVRKLKLAVVKKIQEYVKQGGFLFAMCLATDTLDIAIAAEKTDIINENIDNTPVDPDYLKKISYKDTLAFKDFDIYVDPFNPEHSSIDANVREENLSNNPFTISLFEFSAKVEPVLSMLTQNHTNVMKGFLGATTGFKKIYLKDNIKIMGTAENKDWVTYIHGDYGKGTFTYYAGHDPEDYAHYIKDPPTDLNRFPNSPGYRIILNNVLFPAAKKKKRKT